MAGDDGQLGLFDVPRTHTGDPVTSHRAEAQSKGRAMRHASLVYDVVKACPGLTSSQIAAHLREDSRFSEDAHTRLYQVRRRLSDLRIHGVIDRETKGGSRETVWSVTKQEEPV
jgi:hypothetical protein